MTDLEFRLSKDEAEALAYFKAEWEEGKIRLRNIFSVKSALSNLKCNTAGRVLVRSKKWSR